MKFEVNYSIGGPTLYLNDDKGREISRLNIPDDIQRELATQCIRHVMHNGSEEDRELMLNYMNGWVTLKNREASK